MFDEIEKHSYFGNVEKRFILLFSIFFQCEKV